MASISLDCPLCGSPLPVMVEGAIAGTDIVSDSAVDGHIHIGVVGAASCANAHRWNAIGTFILERVS